MKNIIIKVTVKIDLFKVIVALTILLLALL